MQVLDRAVALLRALASEGQPLTAVELAKRCGLNRSTAWRILVTLEHNRLVERDPLTQRYVIAVGLTQLGESARSGSLVRLARPVLEELAQRIGEQVSLGLPDHFGCTYVDQAQPRTQAHVPIWLGRSGPLHATASGKVFLSVLPAGERDAVLPSALERFTATTITERERLDQELEAVSRNVFAICRGEHDELVSAVCAPVLRHDGRLAAIIDVWGATPRLPVKRLRQLGPVLATAGREIGARLP